VIFSEFVSWALVEFWPLLEPDRGRAQKEAILRDGGIDNQWALEQELETLYTSKAIYHPFRWYRLPANYHGRYTITDQFGFRNDPERLQDTTDKIAFFGGSTLYSVTTDEAGSLPALIEKKLDITKVQVINFGIAGYSSSAELATFIEVLRTYPHITHAVFFDGVNEVSRYIEQLQDHEVGTSYDAVGYPWMKSSQHAARNLLGLSKYWARFPYTLFLAKKVHRRIQMAWNGQENREEQYEDAATKIRDLYVANVEAIVSLARDRGIVPVFILQPTVFSKNSRTPWEQSLYLEEKNRAYDVAKMFEAAYSRIRSSDKLKNVHFVDMSSALDNVELEREYFYDAFHVSALGNREIAEKTLKLLIPFLPADYTGEIYKQSNKNTSFYRRSNDQPKHS